MRSRGVELLVACDVTTPFLEAATVFGPQKGADAAAVSLLSRRLVTLAARYRDELSTDVTGIAGGGAAGGLAGGLAVLGARVVSGFDLVAELVGLDAKLAAAELVVTGEGRLDPPSFAGKVVGGVIERVGGRVPVLCVVGDVDASVDLGACRERGVEVVSLVACFGRAASAGRGVRARRGDRHGLPGRPRHALTPRPSSGAVRRLRLTG